MTRMWQKNVSILSQSRTANFYPQKEYDPTKKLIALVLAFVCVLGLVGCGQQEQFLNYKNLVAVAEQSETLSVVKSEDESNNYIIDGLQLAQFLDDANWA